jgi:hypothetical protein
VLLCEAARHDPAQQASVLAAAALLGRGDGWAVRVNYLPYQSQAGAGP